MDARSEDPAAATLRQTAATFSIALQSPVLLRNRRAVVVRAQRSDSDGNLAGSSVIIKRFEPGLREHFLRERAGLHVLSRIAELQGLVPRLLGAAEASLTLLIEDIPHQASLMELLDAKDPALAAQALTITAARLGTLHGHARAAVPAFAALAPATPTPGSVLRDGLAATLGFCQRALRDSGGAAQAFAAGAALPAALLALSEAVDQTGQTGQTGALATITSGDMAPSNVLLGPRGPAFIDFEYCGVRHGFYDAMFWRCICAFPEPVAERMEAFYREGLRRAGVEIDDQRFHGEMFLFVSHRLFWSLGWIKEALFDRDQDFVPGISARWLTRRHLRDYLQLAARRPGVAPPVLLDLAARLAQSLALLWPESQPARELPCFSRG